MVVPIPSIIDDSAEENRLSKIIIGAAIEAHRTLGGPGLLEGLYEDALEFELIARGLVVNRQMEVPVIYKGTQLKTRLRLDMVVNGIVIIECKATEQHAKIFESQALTYLRLTGMKLALVINFGAATIKEGTRRVVNHL